MASMEFLFLLVTTLSISRISAQINYGEALTKSILFFEGQRSGLLDLSKLRNTWRSNSGLRDGYKNGCWTKSPTCLADLSGGYYTGGDNVKYGFPSSFAMTMLGWSIIEYQNILSASGQLGFAQDALQWGTNYILKCSVTKNLYWAQVGDVLDDHSCWQRPEDMDTLRTTFKLDSTLPGSDLLAEAAAALAAGSIAFQSSNSTYASTLLTRAEYLFTLANSLKATYSSSITNAAYAYNSSGYTDELAWGASWLYRATNDVKYLTYLVSEDANLGLSTTSVSEFSWDLKYAGAQILLSRVLLLGSTGLTSDVVAYLTNVKSKADAYACANLPKTRSVSATTQGLIFVRFGQSFQYALNAAFLLGVYGDYIQGANQNLMCKSVTYTPAEMLAFSKSQVDYILGNNTAGMSYMVGFGAKFPLNIHHRGSSIPSVFVEPRKVTCGVGNALFLIDVPTPNPNVHIGAIVGGTDLNDTYFDDRTQAGYGEPAIYINGPAVGILAKLYSVYQANFPSPPPSPPPNPLPPNLLPPNLLPPNLLPPNLLPPNLLPPNLLPPSFVSGPLPSSSLNSPPISFGPSTPQVPFQISPNLSNPTINLLPPTLSSPPSSPISPSLPSIPPPPSLPSTPPPPSLPSTPPPPSLPSTPPPPSPPSTPPPPSPPSTPPPPSPPGTLSPPFGPPIDNNSLTITQTPQGSWKGGRNGQTIFQYSVVISYSGTGIISNLQLSITNFKPFNYWGVTRLPGSEIYTLSWTKQISSTQPYTFGYQAYDAQAVITIASYKLTK